MSLSISEYQNPYIVLGALLIGLYLITKKDAKKTLLYDLQHTKLGLFIIAITIFSIIVFKTDSKTLKHERLKEATRKALSAFIVSYLVRLDLIFAPFFIVFSLDYFLSGWA